MKGEGHKLTVVNQQGMNLNILPLETGNLTLYSGVAGFIFTLGSWLDKKDGQMYLDIFLQH